MVGRHSEGQLQCEEEDESKTSGKSCGGGGGEVVRGHSVHTLCTYKCLRKTLFKEDAGRAHDVVQHVAVLHQGTNGILERLSLHVLILLSLWLQTLLGPRPHFTPEGPLHSPLQRQTSLLTCHAHSQSPTASVTPLYTKQNHIFQGTRSRPSVF